MDADGSIAANFNGVAVMLEHQLAADSAGADYFYGFRHRRSIPPVGQPFRLSGAIKSATITRLPAASSRIETK